MHAIMRTLVAAAALAATAPVAAQPYGSASYGPMPPYAQQRDPSPVPAPGYGLGQPGYAYRYVAPSQRYGATAEAYGADVAATASTAGCDNGAQKCDLAGAYWSFGETLPLDTDAAASADPNAAAYASRGCRLAPAQVSGSDQRYVRVCPDGRGKYRIGD